MPTDQEQDIAALQARVTALEAQVAELREAVFRPPPPQEE